MKVKDKQSIYVMFYSNVNINGEFLLKPHIAEHVVDVRFRCGKHDEWIVHRNVTNNSMWTVTHAPSSLRIRDVRKFAEAKSLARALSATDTPVRMPPLPPVECIVPRDNDMPDRATIYRVEPYIHNEYKNWLKFYRENAEFRQECLEVVRIWEEENGYKNTERYTFR